MILILFTSIITSLLVQKVAILIMMEIKFKQVPRSSIKSNEKVPTMLIQERVTQVRKSVYRTMASHTIYSNINNK